MSKEIVVQIIAILLLIGIGLVSLSTVGFSLRAYLQKEVWGGYSKIILITGGSLTIITVILLFLI